MSGADGAKLLPAYPAPLIILLQTLLIARELYARLQQG